MEEGNIDAELEELEAELNKEEEIEKQKNPKPPKPKPKDIKSEPDLYPSFIENKYHNLDKMNSVEVLEKEKKLCYKIINYKKKIEKDYYEWEVKKKNADKKMKSITSLIEKGTWDLTLYKSKLREQYECETILLQNAMNEPNLAENQRQTLINRITERKNILEGELSKANEHEGENIDKVEQDLEELEAFFNDYSNSNSDLYPNTAEDIYHNIGKFTCLGALAKEKELCDKIIEFKKERNLDYSHIDKKKEDIDNKVKSITSLVENGTWDLNIYKSKILEEKDWEQKLLLLAQNDKSLDDNQKKMLKSRINERIKLIDIELSKNPEEDEE